MGKIDENAVEGNKSYNPTCFCRAFMKTSSRVDVIVNNMADAFNGYIINAKTKYIMSMLEDIKTTVMHKVVFEKGKDNKLKYGYEPKVIARLEKEKEHTRRSTSIIF